MNVIEWTALLGNIGEFVDAIAVVVTLIYLATQIRQNTNAIAGSIEMAFTRELTAWRSRITADPELIKLYDKGALNAQMSDAEKSRYVWMMTELLWLYACYYKQHLRGLISDASWEVMVISTLGMLRSDALCTVWESRVSNFPPDFSLT
jgi:hypothetical protein